MKADKTTVREVPLFPCPVCKKYVFGTIEYKITPELEPQPDPDDGQLPARVFVSVGLRTEMSRMIISHDCERQGQGNTRGPISDSPQA